jgi:hypothetical protein
MIPKQCSAEFQGITQHGTIKRKGLLDMADAIRSEQIAQRK